MKRINLFLMGEKGYHVLERLASDRNINVKLSVIVAQDKKIENDYYDSIRDLCDKFSIDSFEKGDSKIPHSDYAIAIGWRWIIKHSPLIVFHDSFLPKYRGFAPLANMLINGEPCLGVSALFATEDYDKGDIISQKVIGIKYPIKMAQAIKVVSGLYVDLAVEIIDLIRSDAHIESKKQIEAQATYSLWRDEGDYFIDWKKDAQYIKRFVDAVGHPFKGSRAYFNGKVCVIKDALVCDDVNIEDRQSHLGKIIFKDGVFPIVVCGSGLIKLTKVIDLEGNDILSRLPFRVRFTGQYNDKF